MLYLHIALSFILFLHLVEGNIIFDNNIALQSASKEEELPVGTFIIQALTNKQVDSFDISGTAATYFAINNTGHISIKQRIDREALISERITGTITAKINTPSTTGVTQFACVITDINDNVPSFPKRLYEVSTSEATSVGVVIFSQSAVDGDATSNSNLLYSIVSGNDGGKFAIDGTGKVSISSKLDYEQQIEYTLNITVRDQPGLSNWTILVVNIADQDDLPAKFTAFNYFGSLAEDASLGTPILQVKANDLDKGINSSVNYAIDQDSNPSWLFAVNGSTGQITLNGTLNREEKNEYTFLVLATSSFPFSDHATVTIQVTDVNDNKPVFTQSNYNVTVNENMNPGALVVQLKATDVDQGINAKLMYSIQDGVDSNRFIMDKQSGKITTAVKLDREERDSYELTVMVQDLDGNETIGLVWNDTATLFISVKDINDNAPVFINSSYDITINESLAIGTEVIQVTARDRDVDQNIMYSISGGNQLNRFTIGQVDGVISIKTMIDRDTPNNERLIHLQVTATDKKNVSLKSTANVTITIDDVNDNKPQCTQDRYIYNVTENATIGTVVARLNCTDLDSGENSRLLFRVTNGAEGKFKINSTSGLITTTGELDYETTVSYTIRIEVKDHGQPQLIREILVDVKVININDNFPQFTRQMYEFFLPEGDYSLHEFLVGRTAASDKDAGTSSCSSSGQIRYKIVNETGVFSINPITGYLSTSSAFDRESKSNYTIIVEASDMDSLASLSNTSEVVVYVTDVNDNSPVFSQSQYSVNISEAETSGFNAIKVDASDKDIGENSNITFSIFSGNTGGAFLIDGQTGQIQVAGKLDRETQNRYELIVDATDGGKSERASTVLVLINIIDADDHHPVCTQIVEPVKIKENLAPGQMIAKVSITDKDKDIKQSFMYRLQSDDFAVDPNTGVVNTTRSLNRELRSEYELLVEGYYLNQSSKTVNCSVRVLVEDENDNSPVFNLTSPSLLSIMENTTVGTTLLTVTATDDDVSYNADVRYSIIGDGTTFAINATTGTLTLIGSLDREKTPQYTIEIFATDRGLPQSRSSSLTVTINITDVNDNRPLFSRDVYTVEISENANNTRVLDVEAQDKDEMMNGAVQYSITAGNTGNFFIILTNGSIFTAAPLDRETQNRYELTITASDMGEPALNSSATAIIIVTDQNDNAPNITNAPNELRIPENAPLGSPVFTLISNDADADINAQVNYFGSAEPSGKFAIEQTTGTIVVIDRLDREDTKRYKFNAIASDKGIPSLNSSMVEINIKIDDVNDNNPVFNPVSYKANVTEGLPPGTFVTNVTASEKDEGEKGRIVYKMTFGDPDGYFTIDNSTGVISTQKTLDREIVNQYSLVILAMDHGNPPRLAYAYVSVNVIDTNDLGPVFQLREYSKSIKEDIEIGSVVAQVRATDGDIGSNAMITYSLVDGDGMIDFNITTESVFQSESKTTSYIGRIETARRLDRETRDRYNITILASDGKHNTTSNIIITVQDINDNPPVFNMTGQITNITLEENTPGGTRVLIVNVNDKDEGTNAKISYSLQGEEGKFSIDDSGTLYTASQHLDRETKDFYNITVIATDPGNNEAFLIITVHVDDVNDNAPKFNQSLYVVDVGEEYLMYDVIATDKDQGRNKMIRYKIVYGGENGLFDIEATTGNLTSTRKLDREGIGLKLDQNGRATYHLVIEAADQGVSSLSSRTNVIIRVNDKNDVKPTIQKDSYRFAVLENVSLEHTVGLISAVDKDLGANAMISYSIQAAGIQDIPFHINSSSGVLTVNGSLDREKVSLYEITAKAYNQDIPSLFSTALVSITITDINDNEPSFNQSKYYVTLPENIPGGHMVIDLSASDADEGRNADIQYALVAGGMGKFMISDLTGVIRTTCSLDYETYRSFTLNISATDRGSPPLQSFVGLIINVTDYNDHAPVFNKTTTAAYVTENTPINSSVMVVQATDADSGENGKITYSLEDDVNGNFGINTETGEIVNLRLLDYENRTSYKLHVRASDGGTNQLSSTHEVTVFVRDINDNAPQIDPYFNFEVDENAVPGMLIGSLNASDLDSGENSRLKYTLNNRNDIFSVHEDNGALLLVRSVLSLTNQNISLSITCQDGGNIPLTANTTVYVYISPGSRYKTHLVPRHTNISIYENATQGQLVTILNASRLHTVRYIRIDEDHGIFKLNSTTGEIILVGSLNREKKDFYQLFVGVRDITERLISGYGTVTVAVLDVNDNAPTFLQKPLIPSIPENSPNGTVVTRIQATDLDEGVNQQVFFYIEGSSSRLFSIDNHTGVVTTIGDLDFETNPSYNITVIAENTLSTIRLRSKLSFLLPVKDVLDFMPRFAKNVYNASFQEDISPGSAVIDLNATINDKNSNFIAYRILHNRSSRNSYDFTIEPETGELTTQTNLDRETTNNYSLVIEARDLREPKTFLATTTVIVTLIDVNDNIPSFAGNKSYSFYPKESLGIGDVIGRMQAEDKDEGENGGIDYAIIEGNEKGYFRINSTSGEIFLEKVLDYESVSTIKLRVRAYDKMKSRRTKRDLTPTSYDDAEVTISIQDVNDNPPFFTQTLVVGSFYPEDSNETILATVKATDKDSASYSIIKYIIHNQTISRALRLNSQSGQVTRNQALLSPNGQSYSMVVTARDNNGQVPYQIAANDAAVIVFQLASNRSLTITIGIPLSLVQKNQDFLVSILRNVTGQNVILKSLKESPSDPSTTLAVMHLTNIQARTVLSTDEGERLLSSKSKELNSRYGEWKINVYSPTSTSPVVRSSYFSAYIGAMIAFAVLIGIVGLCAILVVCRYKYREKYIQVYEPDEKDVRDGTEIPDWTRLKTSRKSQSYKPTILVTEEEAESVNESNDGPLLSDKHTVTSVLSSRYGDDNISNEQQSTTSPQERNGRDNPALQIETNQDEASKQQSILVNPFSKGKFSPGNKISNSQEKEESILPKTMFSPKSYSPRDHENKVLDENPGESMSYNVSDGERGIKNPSGKRTRVRFDLETSTGDELEWERQVSNTMPDLVHSTNASNYDMMYGRKNESRTEFSPVSSVSDGEQCEVWDLEDDHGFIPLHDENINRYDVNKTTNDVDGQVTQL